MAVVLDTSAVIELERSLTRDTPPDFPSDETAILPAVVWAEALVGARLTDSPIRAARRRAHLEVIRRYCDIQSFTADTAEHYADIYAELSARGLLIPQNDIAVAATGRSLGLEVLVGPNDEEHFRRVEDLAVRVISL